MKRLYTFGKETSKRLLDMSKRDRRRYRNDKGNRRKYPVDPSSPPVIVVTDEAISQGSSGDCVIYRGAKGQEEETTSVISCYNRFADLGSGVECIAMVIGGGWELVAAECESDSSSS